MDKDGNLRCYYQIADYPILLEYLVMFGWWLCCSGIAVFFLLVYFSNAENEQSIFDAVLHGHIDFSSDPWPSISSSAKDLVKKMLREDPKERLSANEVLSKS